VSRNRLEGTLLELKVAEEGRVAHVRPGLVEKRALPSGAAGSRRRRSTGVEVGGDPLYAGLQPEQRAGQRLPGQGFLVQALARAGDRAQVT
jgi:hypothetical protein